MSVRRALAQFDAAAFVRKHGGRKESTSVLSQEYLLTCPACGSSRLRWNATKKQGAWTCWGCHRSGDTLALVRMLEKTTELGAIDYVMQGYVGGDQPTNLEPVTLAPRVPQRATVKHLPAISWPHGVDLLAPVPVHARAFDYLRARKHFGVDPALLAPHRVGFGRSGRLDGYLVFPCWMDGGLAYWQGRATWDPPAGLSDEETRAWKESTGYRKTLNPVAVPGSATAADVIFGYDHARTAEHVVICEGPMDAAQIGIPSASLAGIALLGKAWSDQKLARLIRLPARRMTVYLDRGREEWESACKLAAALNPYVEVYLALPPEGCDAGSLTPAHNAVVLAHAARYTGQAPLLGVG